MNDEQKQLVKLLKTAVKAVYREKRFLFEFSKGKRRGLEQAFVFRTGIHLSRRLSMTSFRVLDLDSEYNKNHDGIKRSRRFPQGVRPDMIIHERDSNDKNKLVVEFKGYWNKNIQKDIKKLEDLTSPDDEYKYKIGVFVIIGENEASYRYFINGSEYTEVVEEE